MGEAWLSRYQYLYTCTVDTIYTIVTRGFLEQAMLHVSCSAGTLLRMVAGLVDWRLLGMDVATGQSVSEDGSLCF